MKSYASGNGHVDLAKQLGIQLAVDLSQSGCSNTRIIRTTLKDSFLTDQKTLYILGMTFVSRSEIPILKLQPNEDENSSFEGRWTNPQNQIFKDRWEYFWSDSDTDLFVRLKLKEEQLSLIDRTEDLMYKLISMIDSLLVRNHKVLIYQQADTDYFRFLDLDKLKLFKNYNNFVHGFKWCAIPWQHNQGVEPNTGNYSNKYGEAALEIRHRKPGHHSVLNNFLTNYITDNKILL